MRWWPANARRWVRRAYAGAAVGPRDIGDIGDIGDLGDLGDIPRLRGLRLARSVAPTLAFLSALVSSPLVAAPPAGGAENDPPPTDPALPDGFVPAELIEAVTIVYPEELAREEPAPRGEVAVEYVVGVDGVPKELSVVASVDERLDALALEAVGRLRYRPATYKGDAVEVVLSISIPFEPPAAPEPEPAPDTTDVGGQSPAGDAGDAGDAGEGDTSDENDENDEDIYAVDDEESAPSPVGTGPLRVRGQVREAGMRTPLDEARILAVPAPAGLEVGRVRGTRYELDDNPAWSVGVTTDAEGNFELRGVPVGNVHLVVLREGYERLDYIERVPDDGVLELEYFAVRSSNNPFRTVVDVEEGETDVAKRSISREEINALPGTQGDALKAIQNFPGVARTPFGAGGLVIRGASPSDSQVFLGYHEIPNLFHFGALTSVFNSDILAQIDFIPGNFDSRFGDAIGGVVNVQPRAGRRDGYHGYIDSDLFDTGLMLEGPVGKGSFVLSGRRSYIDALLPLAIPDDAGLDFNVAPRYYDYQALLDYPVGDGMLSVRVFGSDDRLEGISQEANETGEDDRNSFGTVINFHRADLVYRVDKGPWSFLITPSYRHDLATGSALGIFNFRLKIDTFSGRAEISRQLSERAALRIGTDVVAGRYGVEAKAPGFPTPGVGDGGETLAANFEDPFARPSLYATATIAATPKLTLYPGMRLTYNALVFRRMALDPRFRLAYQISDTWTFKGGLGTFSQVPDVFEFNPVWGNSAIGLERAVHASAGVEKKISPLDMNVEVTGFYKYIWDLARPSTQLEIDENGVFKPERFWSTGNGHVFGAEFLLRKDLTKKLFGWVSYTYSRSLDRPAPGEDLRPFPFDQPHIFTGIVVYKLPHGWQLGGRLRLVSGNPTTPITDALYDASDDDWIAVPGAENSDRLPLFHQLDVRVDKKWTFKYVLVNLYLDVQNVYNARNVESFNYSYDFKEKNAFAGLPIIPSLGARLEF